MGRSKEAEKKILKEGPYPDQLAAIPAHFLGSDGCGGGGHAISTVFSTSWQLSPEANCLRRLRLILSVSGRSCMQSTDNDKRVSE